jgi:dethiobiotin synthetase
VDDPLMLEGARWWLSRCEFLIVEGAGGVMSPISQNSTCLDLAVKLKLPVVLVAANRLGCVSHVLVCAEAILRRGLTLLAVLLNELPTAKSVSMADEKISALTSQSSLELIASFLPGTPLVQDAESLMLLEQFPR